MRASRPEGARLLRFPLWRPASPRRCRRGTWLCVSRVKARGLALFRVFLCRVSAVFDPLIIAERARIRQARFTENRNEILLEGDCRLAVAGVDDGERGLAFGLEARAQDVELVVGVDDHRARLERDLERGDAVREPARVDGDPAAVERRNLRKLAR